MSAGSRPPELRDLVPIPKFLGPRPGLAHPVSGVDPAGRPVAPSIGDRETLLLFLTTTCDGCRELWAAFAAPAPSPLPDGVGAVLITRGPPSEATEAVAALAGEATVVMGDDPWNDYEVPSGPFFVLVDGPSGRVLTEGVAWSVGQIRRAVEAATTA